MKVRLLVDVEVSEVDKEDALDLAVDELSKLICVHDNDQVMFIDVYEYEDA